ncbi:MAG: hypothetical protein H6696_12370 [Deferribacteres bacterium]|nr:hypothetical protein [candidate division KSB1 bacterium]MCB9502721.1 hypothetical protein [Deferribacteres bacterium]
MKRITYILISLFLLIFTEVLAQSGSYYNPKDDQYRLLGLRRARESYRFAVDELERQKELFEKSLISKNDLERARNAFADAEVNYHQALLAVLFEKQYVAIQKAIKYQGKDGRKKVRITLENASGSTELQTLINIEDELFRALQPDVVHNIYISLLNDENAIISQPYEIKIDELWHGKPKEVSFELLQDVDAVSVNLIYGNGTQNSRKIYLQKDASVDKVVIQSEQFSQEADLGATANYALTLELFSGRSNTFKLEVVNLPQQINRYFTDPASRARLSQFRFQESSNTRQAALQINLPNRPSEFIPIDQPIAFFVLVIPRNRLDEFGDLQQRNWTQKEIEALDVGFVRLELLPRGIGKLQVRAPQLYQAIHAGENGQFFIDLVNDGTRRLDNVEIEVDPPLNWEKKISPALVPAIDIGAENRVQLELTPPNGVAVGRHEIRVRTSSLSNNQPIAGEDKTLTVEILPETNFLSTILILFAIVALVGGIVVFGIRLSRR